MLVMEAERFGGPQVLTARQVPDPAAVRSGKRGSPGRCRLLDRIAHPGLSPAVHLLPTELVLRSSCGCPPGPATRQAVKTIRPAHAN
jgi:hypothetical protein